MNFALYILVLIYSVLISFIIYAGCQDAIKQRRWRVLILPAPFLIWGGFWDIVLNQVLGRLEFLEWRFTWTFSQRLDLHTNDTDWRGPVARAWGRLLNVYLKFHISGV